MIVVLSLPGVLQLLSPDGKVWSEDRLFMFRDKLLLKEREVLWLSVTLKLGFGVHVLSLHDRHELRTVTGTPTVVRLTTASLFQECTVNDANEVADLIGWFLRTIPERNIDQLSRAVGLMIGRGRLDRRVAAKLVQIMDLDQEQVSHGGGMAQGNPPASLTQLGSKVMELCQLVEQ